MSERRKYVGGIISQKYASLKVAKYQQNGPDLHINYLANLVLFEVLFSLFFLYQKKLTATEIVTRLVVAPMRGIYGSVYKFYGKGDLWGGEEGGGSYRGDICSKL